MFAQLNTDSEQQKVESEQTASAIGSTSTNSSRLLPLNFAAIKAEVTKWSSKDHCSKSVSTLITELLIAQCLPYSLVESEAFIKLLDTAYRSTLYRIERTFLARPYE